MRLSTMILICALGFMTTGCAGGLVALQVAGYAKTAYDYQDVVLPDERVNYSDANASDRVVENRLMQRLDKTGILSRSFVEPSVISGHVFLVGAFASEEDALNAQQTAKATRGVKRLTCSFFLTDPTRANSEANRELSRTLRSRLAETPTPLPAVRVSAMDQNAVLMGFVPSDEAKQDLESMAWNTEGVRDVRSYLTVR